MGKKIEIIEGIVSEQGWVGDNQSIKNLDDILGDVLISRGGTAFHLARNLNRPVVTVNTGPFDILECCKQAKHFSPNIVITTFNHLVGLGLLEEVLGVTITELVITSMPELKIHIAKLAEEGNYCVVAIIFMQCGGIRYRDDAKKQAEKRPFEHYVIPRFTSLRVPLDKEEKDVAIHELYSEIADNGIRNEMIIADVIRSHENGRN